MGMPERIRNMSDSFIRSSGRLPAFGSRSVTLAASLFVLYAVWCNVCGWLLSAVGMLGPLGYLVVLLALAWGMAAIIRQHRASVPRFRFISRRRLRLREWMFLGVLVVSLAGACTTAPFGWDACAYRIPRVQRWLAEHRWCWLNSADDRMDISALAYEWLVAPQLALLKTDRLLFLNNLVPYALMPCLLFLAATATGLARRWALFLSAIVPFGYCYALQSAGLQNDGIGAFFGLAAVVLGRSRSARWLSPIWRLGLCFLSLALLSGLKITSAPLAGVLGIWIAWRERDSLRLLLSSQRLALVPCVLACVLCSIIPISIANQIETGHWSGDPDNHYRHKSQHPLAAVGANTLFLAADSITPNVFSGKMNAWLAEERSDPRSWFRKLTELHPHLGYFRFPVLGYEGTSGLGAPLLLILSVMIFAGLRRRKAGHRKPADWFYIGAVIIAYSVFMSVVAVHESQRHAAGYYPLLLIAAGAVLGGRPRTGGRLMSMAVVAAGGLAMGMLVVSPLRVVLPSSVTDFLDSRGAGFGLHREASLDGSSLTKSEGRDVWYALSWGAVSHRLHAPHHDGRMIELGSRQAEGLRPSGKGLFFGSEEGISDRFGLTMEEFLASIGPHRIVSRDSSSPRFSRSEVVGTLYELEDLAKLPPWTTKRLYPHK